MYGKDTRCPGETHVDTIATVILYLNYTLLGMAIYMQIIPPRNFSATKSATCFITKECDVFCDQKCDQKCDVFCDKKCDEKCDVFCDKKCDKKCDHTY